MSSEPIRPEGVITLGWQDARLWVRHPRRPGETRRAFPAVAAGTTSHREREAVNWLAGTCRAMLRRGRLA